MLNKNCHILMNLIRAALHEESLNIVNDGSIDWVYIGNIARAQGVTAIVWKSVMRLMDEHGLTAEQMPDRRLKLRWALGAEAVVNRYELQRKNAASLADIFAEKGIRTVVMKGLAIGTYYPQPQYRECGDLDCFLGEDYERGNRICERIGAYVSRDYYKHSTIKYRGLPVENHRYFLPVRGSRRMKALERHLRDIVLSGKTYYVPGTKLIVPSPDFNALFLTMHGFNHFLSEGIKLRHILDWALFLNAEQHNIDWSEFYRWTDKMHMTRFADALTAICMKYLGLQIADPAIHTESPYAERILYDTLFESDGINNKGYSPWKTRFMLVRHKLSSAWKYHKIYRRSVSIELLRSAWGFLFERNPKL